MVDSCWVFVLRSVGGQGRVHCGAYQDGIGIEYVVHVGFGIGIGFTMAFGRKGNAQGCRCNYERSHGAKRVRGQGGFDNKEK